MKDKKLALLLVIFILVAVVIFVISQLSDIGKQIKEEVKISPSISKTQSQEGWKVYEEKNMGVSFEVPEEFEVEKNGKYSVMAKHPSGESKVGQVEFFYVSVVKEDFLNSEAGEVYNYSKSFHQKLVSIPVGQIKNLSENQGQRDWYMYERMGDQVIGGRKAQIFLNQRPWEFPSGIWEYRYVFNFPKKIVIAGGYIYGGPSDTPLSLPVFQKIIESLSFL